MKVDYLQLKQSYHFQDLKINFQSESHPVSLILGDQASGKTAIVKNIYQALTWFSARFKDLRSAGVVMLDQDIMQQRSQSKIDIGVRFPSEIGQLPEGSDLPLQQLNSCHWQLYKTLGPGDVGSSRVETKQLEQCIGLYYKATQQDPLQGLPMIAYYPSERFINEINLLSKNNPSIFQSYAAYEYAAIPFTTFARFFEWLREVSDIENAHSALLFQQLIDAKPLPSDHIFSEEEAVDHLDEAISNIHAQQHSPHLNALKYCLRTVFPELTDIYIDYQPKLQLMVCYEDQNFLYQQLPSSLKIWIALVGDVVRRLCLLNPLSLYPCQEGEGILLIDQIDQGLDGDNCGMILDRLHQAFPQLQIIATGQRSELLDNAYAFQYFKLEDQNLKLLKHQDTWQHYENLYQQLQGNKPQTNAHLKAQNAQNQQGVGACDEALSDEQSKAQLIFEQIQQLSETEQHELNRLMHVDDDPSLPVSSCS